MRKVASPMIVMVIASMALRPLVAIMAEDRGAQGAGEVADGEGAERRNGAQRRIGRWKEQLVEDERGCRGVDQEIVPLDRRAYDA